MIFPLKIKLQSLKYHNSVWFLLLPLGLLGCSGSELKYKSLNLIDSQTSPNTPPVDPNNPVDPPIDPNPPNDPNNPNNPNNQIDPPLDPAINHAPVFNYDIDDQFIEANKIFDLSFSEYFTDEDQDSLYYIFILSRNFDDWGDWLAVSGVEGKFYGIPPDDLIGSTLEVVVYCIDYFGLSVSSNTFNITVIDEVIL